MVELPHQSKEADRKQINSQDMLERDKCCKENRNAQKGRQRLMKKHKGQDNQRRLLGKSQSLCADETKNYLEKSILEIKKINASKIMIPECDCSV